MGFFELLSYYFSFNFVWYALIATILVSLCAGLLGAILVFKQYSYIGDGLSHASFGALAVAAIFQFTDSTPFILGVTILFSIFLLCFNHNGKVKSDAAIAVLAVSSLAIGYILMNKFPVSSNVSGDVCNTLFGSTNILTLTKSDVYICIGVSIFVVILFVLLYNYIFAITFDENFSRATGINVKLYNLIIAIVVGGVIVLAMKLVGSLLTSALIIFPSLTAMMVCRSFKSIIIFSVIDSLICSLIGLLVAMVLSTPLGAMIVVFQLASFLIFGLVGKILKR